MAKLKGPNPTLCIMSEKRVNPESQKKKKKKKERNLKALAKNPDRICEKKN